MSQKLPRLSFDLNLNLTRIFLYSGKAEDCNDMALMYYNHTVLQ